LTQVPKFHINRWAKSNPTYLQDSATCNGQCRQQDFLRHSILRHHTHTTLQELHRHNQSLLPTFKSWRSWIWQPRNITFQWLILLEWRVFPIVLRGTSNAVVSWDPLCDIVLISDKRRVNGEVRGQGSGQNQKQAKEMAARQAWVNMGWDRGKRSFQI